MNQKIIFLIFFIALTATLCLNQALSFASAISPPASPVKLIFIHHSVGENWLADENGGLGLELRNNNYFVSDTNYGWGPNSIGDNTDIGNWWDWFRGASSSTYLSALYGESNQNCTYSRLTTDPGGENQIVMFKSCFPNSQLGGSPTDSPTTGTNPLRGQNSSSEHMTVGNAKGIYNDILSYFATRQDKLFILITAPPLVANATDSGSAANARALTNWLVNDWLDTYPYHNVAVFNFFNVLTSNGGNVNTNDAGQTTGNHHRWWNNAVQHIQTVSSNFSAYGSESDPSDSHPTTAGNQKATTEFINLLNYYYNLWHGSTGASYTYYLPYFTGESGFWIGVGLSNSSTSQTANVSVTVFDQTGQQGETTTQTIAPDGQEAFSVSSTSVQEGWMRVSSDQLLTGLCFLGMRTIGVNNYMADIPLASSTSSTLVVPHVGQNEEWDTEILICNPNSSSATVTLTFVNSSGQSSNPQNYTIPALGSEQISLSSILGQTTADNGKVKITSTQGVVAFALYDNRKSGGMCFSGINAVSP